MPYPSQINAETIVQAAAALIETHGADGVSLSAVGAVLGVKAPSLYRYFDNKTALLRAVNQQTVAQLNNALMVATDAEGDPAAQVMAMFWQYRAFAHAHPALYSLAYLSGSPELRVGEAVAEQLGSVMQGVIAALVGTDRSLPVLRAAWGLAHGFVALELAGLFERSGGEGLDDAYREAITLFVEGLRLGQPQKH